MDSFSNSPTSDSLGIRKWFLGALALSLLLHACLIYVFHVKTLDRFAIESGGPRLVRRQFTMMKRVTIPDNRFLDEKESAPAVKNPPHPPKPKVELPHEKPMAQAPDKAPEKMVYTPATDLAKTLLNEKPHVEASAPADKLSTQERAEIAALGKQLIDKETPKLPADSKLLFPAPGTESAHEGAVGGAGKSQTSSSLDELLARPGQLTGAVAPVSMQGGALFDYDQAVLRQDAIETLRKLGELIRRNPHARFSIEGHTDSFGSPEYNQKLSEQRAESVKQWLVQNMGLAPATIETRGFGSSRLKAPAAASREAQEINRRVEIVIKTPKE